VSAQQHQLEDELVRRVLASFQSTPDPRLRELMQALVRHLHAFTREVDSLLDSDAVFGAKESLVKRFERQPAGTPTQDGRDLSGRSWSRVRFDIVLLPTEGEGSRAIRA
jgi:hypothetical protein